MINRPALLKARKQGESAQWGQLDTLLGRVDREYPHVLREKHDSLSDYESAAGKRKKAEIPSSRSKITTLPYST